MALMIAEKDFLTGLRLVGLEVLGAMISFSDVTDYPERYKQAGRGIGNSICILGCQGTLSKDTHFPHIKECQTDESLYLGNQETEDEEANRTETEAGEFLSLGAQRDDKLH